MRRIAFKIFLAFTLLVLCAVPVLADDGRSGQVIFGESFTLEAGETLDGDLVVFGGSVDLQKDSTVVGDVVVFGGSATVAGQVDGDLAVIGGYLTLESTAVVKGDLTALGGMQREEGAQVLGNIVGRERWDFRNFWPRWEWSEIRPFPAQIYPFGVSPEFWANRVFRLFRWIITTLGLIAMGLLMVLFVPKQADVVGEAMIRSPWICLGFGVLTALVVILLIPILVVICIGIPVAIVLFIAASLAVVYGWLVAGRLVGIRVKETLRVSEPSSLLDIVIGVPIISLLSAIPYLGPLFSILVAMWGLGGIILTRAGTTPYPPQEPAASVESQEMEKPLPPSVAETEGEFQPPAGAENSESESEASDE